MGSFTTTHVEDFLCIFPTFTNIFCLHHRAYHLRTRNEAIRNFQKINGFFTDYSCSNIYHGVNVLDYFYECISLIIYIISLSISFSLKLSYDIGNNSSNSTSIFQSNSIAEILYTGVAFPLIKTILLQLFQANKVLKLPNISTVSADDYKVILARKVNFQLVCSTLNEKKNSRII